MDHGLIIGRNLHDSGADALPITDPETLCSDVLALLRKEARITEAKIDRARRAAEASGERLDIVLNKLGLVSDADLLDSYARLTGLKLATERDIQVVDRLPDGIDARFFQHAMLLPLKELETGLLVAVADPLDNRSLRAFEQRVGRNTTACIASRRAIEAALARVSERQFQSFSSIDGEFRGDATDDIDRLRDIASEAPIIRLVAEIIEEAARAGASDVHFARNAEDGRVRFRIDGCLMDSRRVSPLVHQAVVSRLKIMAALDIAERRLPQDGRIQVVVSGREIDLRLSTMPHIHGEGAFVRLLDHQATEHDLNSLGLADFQTARIKTILSHPHGLLLVTGPTGSGKTTTLYSALQFLNDPSRNIVTVEDPIEYTLPGINQIQVNRRAGLDFARALRSVLRQDPDIIMVGEIRDKETAAIAIQAALTGHLVLATLHTNDAISAIDRLLDMEIEPFLLASVLRGTMAQRLVRKFCTECSPQHEISPGPRSGSPCTRCSGSGFSGRMPVVEIVPITPEIQQMITAHQPGAEIMKAARSLGFASLEEEAERLVRVGLTSKSEILRALGGA